MHEIYMQRCIDLARLAGKNVRSNPNVGSVLVHEDRIIGESFHKAYGEAHAERNAIASVKKEDRELIPEATLYISLEPCNISAKTPPCSELIIESGIKKIVIGTKDPNPIIAGSSIAFLEQKGIHVIQGILESEAKQLIAPFVSNLNNLPYVILKYAQSTDNYIGKRDMNIWLSNDAMKRKSHLWRTEVDAILVGYNTALIDNPKLTTRHVPGESPLRIIIDRDLSLPRTHHVWSDSNRSLFVCDKNLRLTDETLANKEVIQLDFNDEMELQLCLLLYQRSICRLLVEGGAKTLNKFINSDLWNEARVIKAHKQLGSGIRAPYLKQKATKLEKFLDDTVQYYYKQ